MVKLFILYLVYCLSPQETQRDFLRTQGDPPPYRCVVREARGTTPLNKVQKERDNQSTCATTLSSASHTIRLSLVIFSIYHSRDLDESQQAGFPVRVR